MIKNYFKIAFRGLMKNKGYSFLNIFGLAIGIACAALIFLWVEDEVSYDNNNFKKDSVYLLRENQQFDTRVFTHSSTPGLLGPSIQSDVPGIANTCRMSEMPASLLFTVGNNSFFAKGKYAENSVFDLFTLPFVRGNAKGAFAQLYSVVITEKTAKKFFGSEENVIGKMIRVDNKQDYVVSGVLKDLPTNSTIQFEWLMPFKIYFDKSPWLKFWGSNALNTFVELKPGANPETINKQLHGYIEKHLTGAKSQVFLFSMKDWHLYDEFDGGKKTGGGQIQYVRLFTIIAWIILFIACINFMNLATARSEKRAREVGVRKVLGAEKRTLVLQFIGEALFMAFISAIIALLFILLVLPMFNTLVQKQLSPGLGNPYHIVTLIAITAVCGLVAGSYPSLYLSSFNPVTVLKGIKLKGSGAAVIRKGLVVMQFTVSIVLIICTIIVLQQIQHVKTRQLGLNKDGLVELNLEGQMSQNFASIKQDLLNTGVVENVALSDHPTINSGNNTPGFEWNGKAAGSSVLVSVRNVTPGFMATSGIKIIEGRDLTIADTAGQSHVLV